MLLRGKNILFSLVLFLSIAYPLISSDSDWKVVEKNGDRKGKKNIKETEPTTTSSNTPQHTSSSTVEEATQLLSTKEACKKAYDAVLKYRPEGIKNSIDRKHLESNKQKFKGYFTGTSAEKVLDNLHSSQCVADSTKYVPETNIVECHIKCNEYIGYDVNIKNNVVKTKNMLLIYKANKDKLHQTFVIEMYPRENNN